MSNTQLTTKQFFQRDDVKSKFNELLGTRTNQFMTSLLSIVNNNSYLRNASPDSIYTSAMMAAALDLPINPNLGFAYIIPYGNQAQFQIGYKGLIQLALRSGQFKTISVTPVYEGQLLENNPLTKNDFNAMAQKTCLKLLLSKYAPLSIEMQKAVMADQAVIKNVEDMEVEYVDNGTDHTEAKEQAAQTVTARIDKLKAKTND